MENMAKMTFDQWLRVWWLSWKSTGTDSKSSEIRETALEKMKGLAQTPDQWLQVWEKAPEGSKIQKTALEKMKGLSRFFK